MANKVNMSKEFLNTHLKGNLHEIQDMVMKKFDGVILIDGMEGSGKSELGKQICLTCNSDFNDKDVFYTVEQFEEWLESAPAGRAGLWDEFVLAGLSSEALTTMQNALIKKFTLIRKKNLIIVLIIPYIFMLRKYFAVARTRCLIHVYTKGKDRGFFKFYNYQQKLWIYNYGQKTWLYSSKVNPSFEGKFKVWSDKYINEGKIDEKKDNAIKSIDDNLKYIKLTSNKINMLQEFANIEITADYEQNPNEYKTLKRLVKQIQDFRIS